jgi:hypothetical protein
MRPPTKETIMYTYAQIAAMSPEELTAANKVMARKIAFRFIVKPILIVTAVAVAIKVAERMTEDTASES